MKRSRRKPWQRPGPCAAALVLACVLTATAQERPFLLVEPASITPRGLFELQTGIVYKDQLYLPLAKTSVNEWLLFDTALSYGFADSVEVELHAPAILCDSSRSHWDAGNITLSTKFRLPPVLSSTSSALRASVRLPQTEDQYGLGTDELAFSGDVLLSWARPTYDLHLNAGILIEDDPTAAAAQNDMFRYGIAFCYHSRRIAPLVELSGTAGPEGAGTRSAHNVLVGARIPRRALIYDVGVSVGLNPDNHRFGLSLGITWQKKVR